MQRIFTTLLLCATLIAANAQQPHRDITVTDSEAMRASAAKNTDMVDKVVHLDATQRAQVLEAYMWQERQKNALDQRTQALTPEQRENELAPQRKVQAKYVDDKLSSILSGAQMVTWRGANK